jgi:hypothetical protein
MDACHDSWVMYNHDHPHLGAAGEEHAPAVLVDNSMVVD